MIRKLMEYHDREELDIVVAVVEAQVRSTKKGKPYLRLELGDSSGQISGNFWGASDQDLADVTRGTIVELNGQRQEYQGHPQIKVYALRVVGPNEGYDLSQFVKSAPYLAEEMMSEITQRLDTIENPIWHQITAYLLKKWQKRFFSYPAGRSNHHALKGGLAFHTVTMLKDAQGLCDVYPQVNRSLLYAGCILHDMGKVIELSGPVATEYTREGNLVGHLVLIDEQIVLAAQTLNLDLTSEDLLLLRHMVLSHHGQLSYGSPKQPALLEAELLHRIDDLDAAVYAITNSLQKTEPGHFTTAVRAQQDRRFYRPKKDEALTRLPNLE